MQSSSHRYSVVWNQFSKTSKSRSHKKRYRDIVAEDLDGISEIIHLVNIVNDPLLDLDQVLSWE